MRYILLGMCMFFGAAAVAQEQDPVMAVEESEVTEEVKAAAQQRMFCRYCGALCMGFVARKTHEAQCPKNPHAKPVSKE